MSKFSLLALAVASTGALAQPAESNLEHISIYASRQAKPVSETLTSVTVLDRTAIEAAQVRDLPALLQQVPGVTVLRQGGRGQTSSIFIRGGKSGHTLVLLDGVRIGAATLGYQSLAMLPLEQIEKIEIIRGPKAALYGSDALGGVIAISSRRSDNLTFNAKAGSHKHTEANLSGSQQIDNVKVFGAVGTAMAEGFNATVNGDPDRDGFEQTYVKAGAELDNQFGLWQWQSQVNDGVYEYDNSWGGDEAEMRQDLHQLQWQGSGLGGTHQLKLAHNLDDDLNYGNKAAESLFRTQRDEVDAQSQFALTNNISALVGGNWYQEEVRKSGSQYVSDSRTNRSGFAGLSAQFGDWLLDGTGRRDQVSGYGGENSYELGAGYQLTKALQLRASQGTGFKVPSFNELYWPGFSNPALKPEESLSREIGLDYIDGSAQSSLVLFKRDLTNLIQRKNQVLENVELAQFEGVEFSQSLRLSDVDVSFNYSWLNSRDVVKKQQLSKRPRHQANLQLDRQLERWTIGLNTHFRSRTFSGDNFGTKVPDLASVVLFGVGTTYQWDSQIRLQLKVDNLLNRSYQTDYGYRQAGLELMFGIQVAQF